jgi:hypothetical protein
VILALGLLALAGAAAVVRQAVLGRRPGVATDGAPAPSSPVPSAPVTAFAALPAAVQSPAQSESAGTPASHATAPSQPATAPSQPAATPSAPAATPSAPAATPSAPAAPASGTALAPVGSPTPAPRGIRQHTRFAAVAVTALAGGVVRLLARRRTGRH